MKQIHQRPLSLRALCLTVLLCAPHLASAGKFDWVTEDASKKNSIDRLADISDSMASKKMLQKVRSDPSLYEQIFSAALDNMMKLSADIRPGAKLIGRFARWIEAAPPSLMTMLVEARVFALANKLAGQDPTQATALEDAIKRRVAQLDVTQFRAVALQQSRDASRAVVAPRSAGYLFQSLADPSSAAAVPSLPAVEPEPLPLARSGGSLFQMTRDLAVSPSVGGVASASSSAAVVPSLPAADPGRALPLVRSGGSLFQMTRSPLSIEDEYGASASTAVPLSARSVGSVASTSSFASLGSMVLDLADRVRPPVDMRAGTPAYLESVGADAAAGPSASSRPRSVDLSRERDALMRSVRLDAPDEDAEKEAERVRVLLGEAENRQVDVSKYRQELRMVEQEILPRAAAVKEAVKVEGEKPMGLLEWLYAKTNTNEEAQELKARLDQARANAYAANRAYAEVVGQLEAMHSGLKKVAAAAPTEGPNFSQMHWAYPKPGAAGSKGAKTVQEEAWLEDPRVLGNVERDLESFDREERQQRIDGALKKPDALGYIRVIRRAVELANKFSAFIPVTEHVERDHEGNTLAPDPFVNGYPNLIPQLVDWIRVTPPALLDREEVGEETPRQAIAKFARVDPGFRRALIQAGLENLTLSENADARVEAASKQLSGPKAKLPKNRDDPKRYAEILQNALNARTEQASMLRVKLSQEAALKAQLAAEELSPEVREEREAALRMQVAQGSDLARERLDTLNRRIRRWIKDAPEGFKALQRLKDMHDDEVRLQRNEQLRAEWAPLLEKLPTDQDAARALYDTKGAPRDAYVRDLLRAIQIWQDLDRSMTSEERKAILLRVVNAPKRMRARPEIADLLRHPPLAGELQKVTLAREELAHVWEALPDSKAGMRERFPVAEMAAFKDLWVRTATLLLDHADFLMDGEVEGLTKRLLTAPNRLWLAGDISARVNHLVQRVQAARDKNKIMDSVLHAPVVVLFEGIKDAAASGDSDAYVTALNDAIRFFGDHQFVTPDEELVLGKQLENAPPAVLEVVERGNSNVRNRIETYKRFHEGVEQTLTWFPANVGALRALYDNDPGGFLNGLQYARYVIHSIPDALTPEELKAFEIGIQTASEAGISLDEGGE